LQLLTPRQRAVLVLRDVLGYRAGEVARMLDATQESVQSALKRARATVDSHLADSGSSGLACQPDTTAQRHLVTQLTDALERADLQVLVGLLAEDVRLSMPPAMLEYRGIDVARRFFAAVTLQPGRSYRTVPTRANGQPALGTYMADPHTGVFRAYGLLVVTIADDRITAVTGFGASVMPRFGLPRTLPGTD
jgi:RNA polymerase sigma-70 factor (ECF subfamily)